MDESVTQVVIGKLPPNKMIFGEAKIKLTIEKFLEYKTNDDIINEEISTQGSLNLTW